MMGSGLKGRIRAGLLPGVLLAAAVALSACSPVYQAHGFAPQPEELATLVPGQDTKGTVQSKIGRPGGMGLINDNAWYYVASTIEKFAYREPKVVDRRVVAITFDENGLVKDVRQFGIEQGRVIDLVTRTTPTYGRELTVVQQLLGDLLNPGVLLQQ
ncbi:MAG: outer membrane protein assembly factor BamE [Alphaproteobacteria bacterium]|nr:MAG: outer membrane protein assembly factor BamE [Alphaproteobacteria bacterium]